MGWDFLEWGCDIFREVEKFSGGGGGWEIFGVGGGGCLRNFRGGEWEFFLLGSWEIFGRGGGKKFSGDGWEIFRRGLRIFVGLRNFRGGEKFSGESRDILGGGGWIWEIFGGFGKFSGGLRNIREVPLSSEKFTRGG